MPNEKVWSRRPTGRSPHVPVERELRDQPDAGQIYWNRRMAARKLSFKSRAARPAQWPGNSSANALVQYERSDRQQPNGNFGLSEKLAARGKSPTALGPAGSERGPVGLFTALSPHSMSVGGEAFLFCLLTYHSQRSWREFALLGPFLQDTFVSLTVVISESHGSRRSRCIAPLAQ
jgi:hypothetical protein